MMDVTIKLGAALVRFRPESANRNTFDLSVPEGSTAQEVLNVLNIPADQPVMLIIDDTLIGPEEREKHAVSAHQTIAVMTPIHAG